MIGSVPFFLTIDIYIYTHQHSINFHMMEQTSDSMKINLNLIFFRDTSKQKMKLFHEKYL